MIPIRTLVTAAVIATISPVEAKQPSFLEAALFFLTSVEPTAEDSVTDREIILRREPVVAYLVDGAPCVVRLRNTRTDAVWQMDFCKITSYRWMQGSSARYSTYLWFGEPDAFCFSDKWDRHENYTDPDFAKIATRCSAIKRPWGYEVFNDHVPISNFGISTFVNTRNSMHPEWYRSQARMVDCFEYIVTLLTGEPPPPY